MFFPYLLIHLYSLTYNARLVAVSDVTEKIKLQKKLTELKVLEQKKIAQATFVALEKERSFIGKELHDNVKQILTSAKQKVNHYWIKFHVAAIRIEEKYLVKVEEKVN